MSNWLRIGDVDSTVGVKFARYACKTCRRECTTCGSEPSLLCVCSPAPRKGMQNKGAVRRRR